MFSSELWQQSGVSTYSIDQSIRFNDDDSAYMHRTPSGAGNQRTATWSCWIKRGNLTTDSMMFAWLSDSNNLMHFYIRELSSFNCRLDFNIRVGSSTTRTMNTNAVFRDPSAWYNFVMVIDTTQAVSTERFRFYVNGQRITSFSSETLSANISQNTDLIMNTTNKMTIGAYWNGSSVSTFMDAYMADIVWIDGTAYGPENFGEFKEDVGIWIPKDVSELTFGTNGFYIDGRDSSDLGDDESGRGNDYTTSGLASHDQMTDTPTNNFPVMNPLSNYYASSTFAEGNLKVTHGGSSIYTFNESTMAMTSGKWYAEVDVDAMDSTLIGVAGQSSGAASHILGTKTDQVGYYGPDGNYYKNNSATSYGNSYATGDIIGIALDLDNNKLYFSKNGTWQNSGVPTSGATGTGAISIPAASATYNFSYTFAFGDFSNSSATSIANFGQDGTFAGNVTAGGNSDGNGIGNFKYSVPSGYLALCTKNLGS